MQNWFNNKLGSDAVWRCMSCDLYRNETRKIYHIAYDKETRAKSKHDACQLVNWVTVQTRSVHWWYMKETHTHSIGVSYNRHLQVKLQLILMTEEKSVWIIIQINWIWKLIAYDLALCKIAWSPKCICKINTSVFFTSISCSHVSFCILFCKLWRVAKHWYKHAQSSTFIGL